MEDTRGVFSRMRKIQRAMFVTRFIAWAGLGLALIAIGIGAFLMWKLFDEGLI
jgi:hypothetical protein